MAHLIKKKKNNKEYYYIKESARINGKPRTVNQVYLGSVERILEMATGQKNTDLNKIHSHEFGSLFMANLVEQRINLVDIIDSVIPPGAREKGPTLGEYFLYAAFNRMIKPCSKLALADWYKKMAVHQVRPVDITSLTSQRYWQKWERVEKKHIEDISRKFFKKVSQTEPVDSGCFLFDTTNYFHYMDSKTSSEPASRGHSKDGKHGLRQIGLGLLVSRDEQVPLFYREYEGNCHDSKLFNRLLEDIFITLDQLGKNNHELTIIIDKGMNSEANMELIDKREGTEFITTYSPAFVEDLIKKDLSLFKPVDTPKNKELQERGRPDDRIVAWRTTGEFWGRDRTVVVTYNPRTAAKQRYSFDKKLGRLQNGLFEMRSKVRAGKKYWTSKEEINKLYKDLCGSLYLPSDLYDLEFKTKKNKLHMYFRKNYYRIGKHIARFGKNIIITSHQDWSTHEIVRASIDRYQVEHAFCQSKSNEFGNFRPIWHWTDSKIRCHLFACVVALTYLRLISIWLKKAGLNISVDRAMQSMRDLSSCLCRQGNQRKPVRIIEEPDKIQAEVLKALGFRIAKGVLQPVKA